MLRHLCRGAKSTADLGEEEHPREQKGGCRREEELSEGQVQGITGKKLHNPEYEGDQHKPYRGHIQKIPLIVEVPASSPKSVA